MHLGKSEYLLISKKEWIFDFFTWEVNYILIDKIEMLSEWIMKMIFIMLCHCDV